jgi:hypothetical protein
MDFYIRLFGLGLAEMPPHRDETRLVFNRRRIAMQWFDGGQIKIKGASAPESDQGPAMATDGNSIYLAYVGNDGKNLYTSSCEIDAANPQSWPNAFWQGNERVRLGGGEEPTANDRPAIAIYPTGPILAYTDHKTGQLNVLTAADGSWNNIGLNVFPVRTVFRQPLMTVCNFTEQEGDGLNTVKIIHICAVDESGNLWFTSQRMSRNPNTGALTYSPWEVAQNLNELLANTDPVPGFTKAESWALTAVGDSGFLIAFTEDNFWVFRRTPRDYEFDFFFQQQPLVAGSINPWAGISTAIFASENVQVHFTKKGSSDLMSGVAGDVTLAQIVPVNPGGSQARTNKPPAAASLPVQPLPIDTYAGAQALLIVYKGRDSGRLYFAYATP